MDVDCIPLLHETIYIAPESMVEFQVNQFRHTGALWAMTQLVSVAVPVPRDWREDGRLLTRGWALSIVASSHYKSTPTLCQTPVYSLSITHSHP